MRGGGLIVSIYFQCDEGQIPKNVPPSFLLRLLCVLKGHQVEVLRMSRQ